MKYCETKLQPGTICWTTLPPGNVVGIFFAKLHSRYFSKPGQLVLFAPNNICLNFTIHFVGSEGQIFFLFFFLTPLSYLEHWLCMKTYPLSTIQHWAGIRGEDVSVNFGCSLTAEIHQKWIIIIEVHLKLTIKDCSWNNDLVQFTLHLLQQPWHKVCFYIWKEHDR